jgi:hypothetical protein
MSALHPRDIYFWILNNIDSAIAVGGAIAGSSLLLVAGSIDKTKMKPIYFAGGAIVATAGKRSRAIFTRTKPVMTIIHEESTTGNQQWFKQQFSPAQDVEMEATLVQPTPIIETADINSAGTATHLLITGSTGEGKSTIAQYLASQMGGSVVVIDPHATPSDWNGLPVVGKGRDYEAIASLMTSQIEEMNRRYSRRAAGQPYGEKLSIICDEYAAICLEEVTKKVAPNWFQTLATEARKVEMQLILLTQSDSVKTLQLEGKGNLRENFTHLRLGKFAIKHAKSLKDEAVSQWLAAQDRAATLDDLPLAVPHLQLTAAASHSLPGQAESKQLSSMEVTKEVEPEVLQDEELQISDSSSTTTNDDSDYVLFLACDELLKVGKSKSFVVEAILGCKGRKFKAGMERLNNLIGRFGDG